jgi:hypothetical protein
MSPLGFQDVDPEPPISPVPAVPSVVCDLPPSAFFVPAARGLIVDDSAVKSIYNQT